MAKTLTTTAAVVSSGHDHLRLGWHPFWILLMSCSGTETEMQRSQVFEADSFVFQRGTRETSYLFFAPTYIFQPVTIFLKD